MDSDDAWSYSFPPSTESLPKKEPTIELIRRREDDALSQTSTTSSNRFLNAITTASLSHTTTNSSTSLQSPFMSKAAALTQTTKEDASSIISKDDTPSKRSSLLTNMKEMCEERPVTSPSDDTSPRFISYRKAKSRSLSGSIKLGEEPPKYDKSLYTDEYFADTSYRYAVMKRNTDFHQLFRSLDLTDRLLDDFSCALSREILLQGRLYVSEHYICFNSYLLGWTTNIVLHVDDIVKFEKRSTAGLFPNGIQVETTDNKYTFASLISRDLTFDFMKTVWEKNRKIDAVPEKPEPEAVQSPKIHSYIMSLDGDEEPCEPADTSTVVRFKNGVEYTNMGPDTHLPTRASLKKEYNETDLCSETINAPLGIVFDILFGTKNTSFHRRFIEAQNGSELSEYEEFHPMEDDPTSLVRTLTYTRALGYSIGPKSTKCILREVIEHMNFADHILVSTTVRTPDVPSGNAFSVKTKYLFTWAENNATRLDMSYYIEWTANSWIKAVIEKQSLSGQKQATELLLGMLREEIRETTYVENGVEETPEYEEKEPVIVVPVEHEETPFSWIPLAVAVGVLFCVLQLYLVWVVRGTNALLRGDIEVVVRQFKRLSREEQVEFMRRITQRE